MSRVVVIGASPNSLIIFRGLLLKALVNAGHEVTAMAGTVEPDVVKQLSAIGVNFRAYPVQRNGMNPVADLQTFFALRKALRALKPDIVLSYTIKPVIWGGIASKGMSRIRFYALITGLGFAFNEGECFKQRMLTRLVSRLYRFSLSRASRVIFQNPDNRDFFEQKHIIDKGKSSLVNGSGVNLAEFAVTPLPSGKDVVFLTIGRLLGAKGFREYAKAARLVKARYPATVFRLVGPTDPSPDGISLAEVEEWQSASVVKYLGKTHDVRPFIADCHVYVLPSYHEGLPRTVLEAMAIGRPILTTDVPGCRETVLAGVNGYLVPKADSESLAARMIWFIENRDQWDRMGQYSRRLAEEKFDVHRINESMLDIMKLKASNN